MMTDRNPLLEKFTAWLNTRAVPVVGMVADSRRVQKGFIFAAMAGAHVDGRAFCQEARQKGAAGIVREPIAGEEALSETKDFVVPNLSEVLGLFADAVYGHPSREVAVIGVTGTNGKTSCTQWIMQALTALDQKTAVIGTLGMGFADAMSESLNTTPDAARVCEALARFRDEGARAVAMEVSSIGLHQHRVAGVAFDTALFTNISRDHLDYHKTMEDYARAKALLFASPGLHCAVINLDDDYGRSFAELAQRAGAKVITYTAKPEGDHATLKALSIEGLATGLTFEVDASAYGRATIKTSLIGAFNVENLLGVLGVLLARGVALADAARVMSTLLPPKGRLEKLGSSRTPKVVVDYAHTPDALNNAALSLRAGLKRGERLFGVMGCGGDRDAGKRPMMGNIASQVFDHFWLTNDNPRSEDPNTIINDIIKGVPFVAREESMSVQPDRARAIEEAIHKASLNDTVLIAGKGHESYQEMKGQRLMFSDQAVAEKALQQWDAAHAMGWRLSEIATTVGGECLGEDRTIHRVLSDSRHVIAGDLFVALKGDRFDGHDFVDAVIQSGAAAIVSRQHRDRYLGKPVIAVDDTSLALADMARAWRQTMNARLLVVTGSNGKTTVKEMIAHIAREYYGHHQVCATSGNLNNAIGLPLTLLTLRKEHKVAVIELGMNHRGETATLSSIALPDAVLINNAQREHQEFMKDVETVALEHGDALSVLQKGSAAILNGQDHYFERWRQKAESLNARVWAFNADARLQPSLSTTISGVAEMRLDRHPPRASLKVRYQNESTVQEGVAHLRVLGDAMIENAQAATAAAIVLGVPLDKAVLALSSFEPVTGRLSTSFLPALSVNLIDDTYNANPDSVLAAIKVLCADPSSQKWLILGDMGEVGEEGENFHHEVGIAARKAGVTRLFAVGALSAASVAAFGNHARHFDTVEALNDALTEALHASCPHTILVKGSRFMKMERVVAWLRLINARRTPNGLKG
ncbi:MAG: UDP-N-acetylmuramoyl-L-alanyl-D-glutamate--2,6-diaminopimelate ligase [Burkholderiales bacterium]|jgi:murE/murF fusion protein|nr:UDP-N-acetylmuramoyl-L-alanyl-D-glutamate--2,6-diaminopimelate ligase [Burkholderiales bacterium]